MPAKNGSWRDYGSGTYSAVTSAVSTLPPGVYKVHEGNSDELLFTLTKQYGDNVYDLPGLPNDYINAQINKFWSAEELYKKYGFIHKRGILLYGPPGNGKTCVITSLLSNLIRHGGIAICIDEFNLASKALRALKLIEPHRQVMTLMEDLDTLLSGDYKAEEPHALSMLDGQTQVNGVVHIATTNYPESLADRFIRRPGRFDVVIGIGMPVKATRRAYFEEIIGKEHPEIRTLVEKTEGLSLGYLREIASSYLCLGVAIEETVGRLKKNVHAPFKVSDHSDVGFKIGYDAEPEDVIAP